MKDQDRIEFARLLSDLGALYGREVDAPTANVYFAALKGRDLPEIRAAVARAAVESQYFPKPVELREFIRAGIGDTRLVWDGGDSEATFRCPDCLDRGFTLRQDKRGCFSRPCRCAAGNLVASSWDKPNDQGRAFADAARYNARATARGDRVGSGIGQEGPSLPRGDANRDSRRGA